MSKQQRLGRLGALLLGAVLIIAFILAGKNTPRPPPDKDLRESILVLGAEIRGRLTLGRITGEEESRTLADQEQHRRSDASMQEFARVYRRVRALSADNPVEALALEGLLSLVVGDLEPAISDLERYLKATDNSATQNDLAAAYLSLHRRSSDPQHLLRALELSREARLRQPDRLEPAFNFALALSTIHLVRSAEQAWRSYLELERAPEWIALARDQLSEADRRGPRKTWGRVRQKLLRADGPSADFQASAVSDFPRHTRQLCEEELLGIWARAFLSGDLPIANRVLADALALASIHSEQGRGDLLRQELSQIMRMQELGKDRPLSARAEAILQLHSGISLYKKQDYLSATTTLDRAASGLREAKSDLSYLADLYLAISRYYDREVYLAELQLTYLLDQVPSEYVSLEGRALWMLGTVKGSQRRFEKAAHSYRAALPLIQASEGDEGAAALDLALAEVFALRGEVHRSWAHRVRALQHLSYHEEARRRFGVAFEATQALARRGHGNLASIFLEESGLHLEEYEAPSSKIEFHLEKARILLVDGREEAASVEIAAALELLEGLDEGGLKSAYLTTAKLLAGTCLTDSDPERALRLLGESRNHNDGSGYGIDELATLSAEATALKNMGRVMVAKEVLKRAVTIYAEIRRDAPEATSRIEAFRHAHQVFDDLLRLSLDDPDPLRQTAFYWSEKSRAQSALDHWLTLVSTEAGWPPEKAVQELQARLPDATVLIEFTALDDAIYCWVLGEGDSTFKKLEVGRAALRVDVRDYLVLLQAGASTETIRRAGQELYRQILSPLYLSLPADGRLLVVPDGPLKELPFSSLVNPESGLYLVQDVAIAVVPSAELFLLAETKRLRSGEHGGILVVGNPDLSGGPYKYLPLIGSSKVEAVSLARRREDSVLLLEDKATTFLVLAELSRASEFHFAGHGTYSRDNWDASALLLSPEDASDDGRLTVREILDGNFSHLKLVTLAACNTLQGYDGGREGNMGLAMAFFYSGVPSVLGTLWPIEDRFSSRLIEDFYRARGTDSPEANALRLATVTAIESRSEQQSSPASWAGFVALGI